MKKIFLPVLLLLLWLAAGAEQAAPKREFRGAWLHVIGQTQYMNKTPEQCRRYISEQLDLLQEAGCNAVIFQVRPHADAMYRSSLEPWSSWLTGKRGKAPNPEWDPLEYTIAEAHKRGMELHAWLNPYRVTSNPKEVLPPDHKFHTEPWRFFRYDNKIFFDPAYQENRDFITAVVADIVTRYDVDAIHMDDYFYPYPVAGGFNADTASYEKLGKGQNKADWRRHNVDLLIEQLHTTIKDLKPWVRFGISPFGIWRNKASDPVRGSETRGCQNYDDLYADVLLWADKGWIDYVAPQLYWELDLKVAPSRKLAQWWADYIHEPVQLYIGQDTKRTMDKPTAHEPNELSEKIDISRRIPEIDGNVWWHGYWVTGNYKGVRDALASKHQASLALTPPFPSKTPLPAKVEGLRTEERDGHKAVAWNHAATFSGYGSQTRADKQRENDVVKYVLYEFCPGEEVDPGDPEAIIAVTPDNFVRLDGADSGTVFIVTAIDRMGRESAPSQRLVVK